MKNHFYIFFLFILFSCNNGVQKKALSVFDEHSLDIKKIEKHIGDNPTSSELYFVGDYYMNEGEYSKAIVFFDRVLGKNDELLIESKYGKVLALIKLQDTDKVKMILESLPPSERNEIPFLEGMLMADFFLGKWTAKTAFYYDKLKEVYPRSKTFNYLDVLHFVSKKDTALAIKRLEFLIGQDAEDESLKLIYLELNCCEDSISRVMVNELMSINSKNTQTQNYYLKILIDDNLIDSAFVESKKYPSFKMSLGKEILEGLIKSRSNESEMYIDWLVSNKKLTNFEELRYRGDIFYEKQNNYKAKESYSKALGIQPDDEHILKRMRLISWRINYAAKQNTNTENESN